MVLQQVHQCVVNPENGEQQEGGVMPVVKGKKFPYTKKGKAKAAAAKKKTAKKPAKKGYGKRGMR
tara:strand:- start:798 stop:992 length:195 start_codon:yes stop_codon:yes gene_type:complete